jgi:protocatechuate 3,4-dioxygenase beta subunit
MTNRPALLLFFLCWVLTIVAPQAFAASDFACPPTEEDEMGPFYRPGAPLRSVVGSGYVLSGTVRSAVDCTPLKASLVEFWMTGPNGWYDDAYRAAVITGDTGTYKFQSHIPGVYGSRPAHIHIRVSAEGYRTLTTQHYLETGASQASFDLVLPPLEKDGTGNVQGN